MKHTEAFVCWAKAILEDAYIILIVFLFMSLLVYLICCCFFFFSCVFVSQIKQMK